MKNIRLLLSSVLCVFGFVVGHGQIVPIITTYVNNTGATFPFTDNGPATAGTLNGPYMITLDPTGNLIIADAGEARIRKVDAITNIITTIAGNGTSGSGGDGTPATSAQLGGTGGGQPGPVGVTVDGAGNLYIGDATNNKVRKVDVAGIITTVAGTGIAGNTGDGTPATAARLSGPRGVAVNTAGTILYIADANNNKIRVVDFTSGIITTYAGMGTAGFAGDGGAPATAQFNSPRGLFLDQATGDLYVTDMSNQRVRKITAGAGLITTVAGSNTAFGFAGDGGPATAARLSGPTDMKMDVLGNMYIADVGNNRLRFVDASSGNITTIVGTGSGGYTQANDWRPATAARINAGASIAIIDPNHYFISDRSNSRIRYVKPNSIPYFNGGVAQPLVVCENSGANSLNALLAITDSDQVQTEQWSVISAPAGGTLGGFPGTRTANGGTVTPVGLTYTPNTGFSGTDVFTIQISDSFNVSTIDINVTVNPLPSPAPIAGPGAVCPGATIVLTDATPGGTWYSSMGNSSVVGGTVTGINGGTTDVIGYSVTNSCGSVVAMKNITINPLPNAGSIIGASIVCVGGNIFMSDPTGGVGTWSASNGNANVSVSGVVSGISAGTVNIDYTVINGCGTAVATSAITVNTVPAVAPIGGAATSVCVGANIIYTDATPGGTWSATSGNAGVVGGTVTGITAGTDVINYAVGNGCGTTTVTKAVTVNPLPDAGTLSGGNNVCLAGTTTLTPSVGGGAWGAANPNATVDAFGVVTGVTVGPDVISYSVTNVCGTAVATFSVNVVTTPSAGTITGPTNVCPGATIPLFDGTVGGVWSASNGNATVDAFGVVTGVTAGSDVISYTVTASCGVASTTYPITINPLANPGSISGSSSVCMGYTTLLTDGIPGGVWSSGATAFATVSGTGMVSGIAVGTATISYGVTNVCGTQYATKFMTVEPNVIPSVTFTASPGFTTCPGTLVTYSAIPVNGGASPAYQWSVNGSVLGAGSSFNHTPLNHDTIVVKMTSTAACVAPLTANDTVVATVNPTLVPSVNISTGIVGDTVCVGTSTAFNATPVNGGTTPAYQWYVNGTLTAAGNPFIYTPNNGDIITAQMASSYACPSPSTVMSNSVAMTVNITEDPAVTITVSPVAAVCNGSTVTFTAHTLYGGIPPFLRWTKNGINVATGPLYILTPANGDNVYCMMASSSSCRTADTVFSNHLTISVDNPKPIAVTITQDVSVIGVGVAATFHATVATTAIFPTYQWFINGVAVTGATGSTFVVTGSLPGTQTVSCVAGTGDACYTTATSNLLSVRTANVGVKELNASAIELQLVPNPNKGIFTMNMVAGADEPVTVIITNILGEKVKEFTTATNQPTEVSLGQSAGIYFLSAHTAHGKYTAKVIVE
jgi:hypothetical protein